MLFNSVKVDLMHINPTVKLHHPSSPLHSHVSIVPDWPGAVAVLLCAASCIHCALSSVCPIIVFHHSLGADDVGRSKRVSLRRYNTPAAAVAAPDSLAPDELHLHTRLQFTTNRLRTAVREPAGTKAAFVQLLHHQPHHALPPVQQHVSFQSIIHKAGSHCAQSSADVAVMYTSCALMLT